MPLHHDAARISIGPIYFLAPQDLLHFADFALNFATDFFSSAPILQIWVARRAAGLLFYGSFGFLKTPLHPVFRARFHTKEKSHAGRRMDDGNCY